MKQLESGLHRRRIEVSKSSPCVHCGKDDWCYVLHDGNISACKRNAEPTAGWYKTRKVDREGTPLYGTIASREAYKEQKKGNDKGIPINVIAYKYQLVKPSESNQSPLSIASEGYLSEEEVIVYRKDYRDAPKDIFQGSKTSSGSKIEWEVPSEWRDRILLFGINSTSNYWFLQNLPTDSSLWKVLPPVFIPEGEKCVQALHKRKAAAICNYGGGGKGKWKESDTQHFLDLYRWYDGKERENWQQILPTVVLMPDRDKPGLEHSVEVLKSLVAAGYPPEKIKWYFCYSDWDRIPLSNGLDIADMFNENPDLTVEDILKNLQTTDACPWLEHLFPGAENFPLPLIDDDDLAFCDIYVDEVTTDIDWTIQDILPSGYSVVLSGQSGSGKSVSAFDIAAAVASGGTWMGKECRQGKVLILNNDQSEMVLKRMLKTRLGDDMPMRSQIAVRHGFIADDEGLARLRKWMQKYDFRLVIMDSIRECICHPLGISQNDAESGYKLKQVAEVVTAAGGCFVAIHHENKSKEAAGVEKASGSTSIISNVDAHWRITKASTGNKLLMPKTRGYSPVEMDYRIDFTNGICHAIEASEGTQHATRNSPTIGERVVAYLKEYESADGATVKEMAEALEVKEHPLREILRRLVNDGVIESVSSEGSKLKVYRLIDENEE